LECCAETFHFNHSWAGAWHIEYHQPAIKYAVTAILAEENRDEKEE
jgi:hypothetical protein